MSDSKTDKNSIKRGCKGLIQFFWPYVFMLAGFLSLYFPDNIKVRAERDLSNPVLTLISILTAITITSFTIFLGEINRTFKEFPDDLGDLILEHVQSIYFGVATCVMCFVVIIVFPNPANYKQIKYNFIDNTVLVVWMCLIILSISLFVRVVMSFHGLTKKVIHANKMALNKNRRSGDAQPAPSVPPAPPASSGSSS